MTENEKAAIAAGLWEPGEFHSTGSEFCPIHGPSGCHGNPAPDMHDLANLWRALEKRHLDIDYYAGQWTCDEEGLFGGRGLTGIAGISQVANTLTEAVFNALVALYDAEHA